MNGIRFGRGQEYVFFRREEVKREWDLPSAIRFLNRFRNDPHAMSAFRRQLPPGTAVGGQVLTDDKVIASYARLLVTGEVVVAYPAREKRIGHLSVVVPVDTTPAPAPAPASQAVEEEDPPTFIEEHDGVAQAETLIAAARGGFPFCEECERRAAAMAPPPAPPAPQARPRTEPGPGRPSDAAPAPPPPAPPPQAAPPPPPAPLPQEPNAPPTGAGRATKEPEPPPTYWVEIALVGEDDKPVPGENYVVELPDGSKREGVLDGKGLARITGIAQNGTCKVSFPKLDRDAWNFVKTIGDTAPTA